MAKIPPDVRRLLDKLYDEDIATVKRGKRLLLGHLYLYLYDAKYKATLPYWDELPLMILLRYHPPYIEGINTHFIPWTWRINFVKIVMEDLKKGKKLNYKFLKRAAKKAKMPWIFAIYSYRKYLINHIRTNIKVFDEEDWRPVVVNVLPKFKKMQDAAIYKDINQKILKQKQKMNNKV